MVAKGKKEDLLLCTFYNTDKFQLLNSHILDLNKSFKHFGVNKEMYKFNSKKDNISQIMHFSHIESEKQLLLVNNHLHWAPENDIIKYG